MAAPSSESKAVRPDLVGLFGDLLSPDQLQSIGAAYDQEVRLLWACWEPH